MNSKRTAGAVGSSRLFLIVFGVAESAATHFLLLRVLIVYSVTAREVACVNCCAKLVCVASSLGAHHCQEQFRFQGSLGSTSVFCTRDVSA